MHPARSAEASGDTNLCLVWLDVHLNCQPPSLLTHMMAKHSHAFTWSNQRQIFARGWDTAGLLTDVAQFFTHALFLLMLLMSEPCLVKPYLNEETVDHEQRKWWEGGGVTCKRPPRWSHQHSGKTLEERSYFIAFLVNLPGNAALLLHGKAGTTETELPNQASTLSPPLSPKPSQAHDGIAPHKKTQGPAWVLWLR